MFTKHLAHFGTLPSSKVRRVEINICIRLIPDENRPPQYDLIWYDMVFIDCSWVSIRWQRSV